MLNKHKNYLTVAVFYFFLYIILYAHIGNWISNDIHLPSKLISIYLQITKHFSSIFDTVKCYNVIC